MTQEKINIAELLKDCPKGMELECSLFNDVKFIGVEKDDKPICIRTGDIYRYLTKFGTWTFDENAKCVIFPKGKTTWEGFQRPFKAGDIVVTTLRNIAIIKKPIGGELFSVYGLMFGNGFFKDEDIQVSVKRLATKEEKQKLFDAIKAKGYKWNPETKTYEKLIEPKFKIGDRIKWKGHDASGRIEKIEDNVYHVDYGYDDGFIRVNLNMQDDYDLVPNKFDINTLIPFESKVLVRDLKNEAWRPAIFGYYLRNVSPYYMVVGGSWWENLIPYEGNEHLIGKEDDCDEFYKNWREG